MDRRYIPALSIAFRGEAGIGSFGLELALRNEGSTASPFLLRRTAFGGDLYLADGRSTPSGSNGIVRFDIRLDHRGSAAFVLPRPQPGQVVVMQATRSSAAQAIDRVLRPTLMVCRRPFFRIEHDSGTKPVLIRRIANGPWPAKTMSFPAGKSATLVDLSSEPDGIYRLSAGGQHETFYMRGDPTPVWGVVDLVLDDEIGSVVPRYAARLRMRRALWRYKVFAPRLGPSAMEACRMVMQCTNSSTPSAPFRCLGRGDPRDPTAFLFETTRALPIPDRTHVPPSIMLVSTARPVGAPRPSTGPFARPAKHDLAIAIRPPTWEDVAPSRVPLVAEVYVHI